MKFQALSPIGDMRLHKAMKRVTFSSGMDFTELFASLNSLERLFHSSNSDSDKGPRFAWSSVRVSMGGIHFVPEGIRSFNPENFARKNGARSPLTRTKGWVHASFVLLPRNQNTPSSIWRRNS